MNTRGPTSERIAMTTSTKPNIPQYVIGNLLATGMWASVYLARHVSNETVVVCKTLKHNSFRDPRVRQRFLREIDITRRHTHPYVVPVLEAGEVQDVPYLIMPYCPRGDLEALRRTVGGRLSIPQALTVMKPALLGLAALHAGRCVHRDVKPQNILLDHTGTSLLADFGLAKSIVDAGSSGITNTSDIGLGSAPFMAREQVTNFCYLDPVTDVWAAAATFYYLVTGVFPRPERPHESFISNIQQLSAVPIRIRDATISRRVASVIDRALLDDIAARYTNVGEFVIALEGAVVRSYAMDSLA